VVQRKETADQGAYVEFVYNQLLGRNRPHNINDYAAAIRAIGREHSVLSSDLGQPGNLLHPDGLAAFFQALREQAFKETEIDQMARQNPAVLLGLP
jgi:hypothetical protein